MSPLTKLFVVLLALSSMLLTSALVVYVNREQQWKQAAENNAALLQAAKLKADTEAADANTARAQFQEAARNSDQQAEALRSKIAEAEQKVAEKNVSIAKAASDLGLLQANVAQLSEALTASQGTQAQQQLSIVEARKQVDELTSRYADASRAIADLRNQLDVTERERRFFSEQLAKVQSDLTKATAMMKERGIDPAGAVAEVGKTRSAPPINGVIKEVAAIEGMPHATISVGQADAVSAGMEFNVIDRESGDFYAKLVIDTVRSNESSGRLIGGPRVTEVHKGLEVRTQL